VGVAGFYVWWSSHASAKTNGDLEEHVHVVAVHMVGQSQARSRQPYRIEAVAYNRRVIRVRRIAALLAAGMVAACASTGDHGVVRIIPPPSPAERAVMNGVIRGVVEPVPLTLFEVGEFEEGGVRLPYRLLRPERVVPGRRYPLVVLMHGSGQIGTDNLAQVGIDAKSWASPEMRRKYPCFILLPQFPDRPTNYHTVDGVLRSDPTKLLDLGLDLIVKVAGELPIDLKRIYGVGYSMGASALWDAQGHRPNLFAAVAAIDGVPNADAYLASPQTALLIVQGDLDNKAVLDATEKAFARLRQGSVTFWRYVNTSHEYPIEFLTRPDLVDWLFAHTLE
jgi:poly(3-hydroxybutyrate) depolymerase